MVQFRSEYISSPYFVYACRQLLKRTTFDSYLSSALGVKLKDGKLQDIDESHYVLTLDYTVKVCHEHSIKCCTYLRSINDFVF